MATELNLNFYDEAVKEYKRLLADKDKLVAQKSDDGRNQFQIKINELKKSIKGQNFKFKDVMNDTLKQEREGKFDRGAEGKKKNKLRKKMAKKPETEFTKGRHKGSDADIAIEESGIKDIDSDSKANISRVIAGKKTKKKKESIAKSR
tara:strand:- start:70 stop:513 length:444 start_codon:yes stop_codon:yes gene_type:complete